MTVRLNPYGEIACDRPHALETAAEGVPETLLIESDSHAEGFYPAMGATHVGHRRSDAGRWLPLLRVAVPSGAARSS